MTALVIPAFETTSYSDVVPKTKPELEQQYQSHKVIQFRVQEWSNGHNATDYPRWFSASQVYPVKWHEGYEPYLVMPANVPRYARTVHMALFGFYPSMVCVPRS